VPVQKPQVRSPLGKWIVEHVGRILIWLATAGSIAGGYAILRPNLTIEPDFLLNESEPLSAYFRIQNAGLLPVYELTFSCVFTGGPFTDSISSGAGPTQRPEPVILPGDSATKNCSVKGFAFAGPASLIFNAEFRPKLWPFRITRSERFSAIQDAAKFFHWTHQPLSN
jgi:hypothetical protein